MIQIGLSIILGYLAHIETDQPINRVFDSGTGLNLLLRYIVGGALIFAAFGLICDLPEPEKRRAMAALAAAEASIGLGVGVARLWRNRS